MPPKSSKTLLKPRRRKTASTKKLALAKILKALVPKKRTVRRLKPKRRSLRGRGINSDNRNLSDDEPGSVVTEEDLLRSSMNMQPMDSDEYKNFLAPLGTNRRTYAPVFRETKNNAPPVRIQPVRNNYPIMNQDESPYYRAGSSGGFARRAWTTGIGSALGDYVKEHQQKKTLSNWLTRGNHNKLASIARHFGFGKRTARRKSLCGGRRGIF